ncbi:uncharacterized protein [Amphiura filiformis]|uniref:uncharacterized protein n=1 Tax=Amphiura filiformis TaxID=82378 RepID=UPI003B2221AF
MSDMDNIVSSAAVTNSTSTATCTSTTTTTTATSTTRKKGIKLTEFDKLSEDEQLRCLGEPPKKILVISERPNPFTGELKTTTKPRTHRHRKQGKGNANHTRCEMNLSNPTDNIPTVPPPPHDIPDPGNDDIIKELEKLLQRLPSKEPRKGKSWGDRMIAQDEDWEAARETIFHSLLKKEVIPPSNKMCTQCGENKCTVRCTECLQTHQCFQCDAANHKVKMPFHIREDWIQGFYAPIPSGLSVKYEDEGEDEGMVYIPFTALPTCGPDDNHELEDLLWSGLWPGSIKDTKYVFQMDLIRWFDTLCKYMPGTSLSAFAQALQAFGPWDLPINRTVLAKVLREYRYSMRRLDQARQFDAMKCPPCAKYQHSAHVDGNFKLYRYKKVPRGARTSLHDGVFVVPDEDVDLHMKDVYSPGQVRCIPNLFSRQQVWGYVWKAARAQNTTKAKQDETGLAVAGCRHTLAQKAVNMFRGEMYGYPHFLHTSFMLQEGVQFMWQDVICKYWPWAKKQQQKPEYARGTTAMKPALSVMHAKAHAWDCQVKWGGRYQEDAGMGTGEEMEQLFSYLSRLNSTTKNMSAASQMAQPGPVEKGMDKAEQQWEEFWAANGNRYSRTDIESWHADIVNIAKAREERESDILAMKEKIGKENEGEEIFEEGKRQVADVRSSVLLQQEIEVTCYGIEKRKVARSKEAGEETVLILGRQKEDNLWHHRSCVRVSNLSGTHQCVNSTIWDLTCIGGGQFIYRGQAVI